MDLRKLKKLIDLVEESGIAEIEVTEGEEKVRITGAKRDDLQAAMALIRKDIADMPLSFNNFRD